MTVYLDLVFALNWFFDFLLLLTVNNTLKRNASFFRLVFSSLFGSITLLVLFFPMPSIFLFFFKIIVSLLLCGFAFGFKDKTYCIQNVSYFYMTSVILGGFLYWLQLEFSSDFLPYLFFVIISPIPLYIYYKERKEAYRYAVHYAVTVTFLDGTVKKFQAFLDTGNKLRDPITKKYIILVRKELLQDLDLSKILYVPYQSLNHEGIIQCLRISSIEIQNKKSNQYLIGISEGSLLRDGVDCVLNSYCLEELL